MTTSPQSTSPRIWEDLAPVTGPQYRSLLCLSRKNRTSSRPLQVLNFRGLVWTAGTVLPVLPIPAHPSCYPSMTFEHSTAGDRVRLGEERRPDGDAGGGQLRDGPHSAQVLRAAGALRQ